MTAWLYELSIDEAASAWASRSEVRSKLDERLRKVGEALAPLTADKPDDDPEAEHERRVNDPANEQGAKALMAVAAGGRRR